MSPFHKKLIKFLAISCIWLIVLIVFLKLINKSRLGYQSKKLNVFQDPTEQSGLNDELLIDTSISAPVGFDWLKTVQQELPNVPFDFWIQFNKLSISTNTTHYEYPNLLKLNFHNIYWQTYQRENITFQLYSAYYDKRDGLSNGPVVRLLAMLNQKDQIKFPASYCQLWYDNNTQATIVPVLDYHRIYPDYWGLLPGYLYPYLLTCQPAAIDRRIPRTISLVNSNFYEIAKNNLRIWFEEPTPAKPKKTFAVCVKALNFPYTDNSARLVEWFELLRLLGVNKVFMYQLSTHPNVTKVLSYYQKIGFVDMHPLTLAGGEPSLPFYQHKLLAVDSMNKRLNEYIPYNDCLYRNMYKFDYIAALDVDEMIMPLEPYRNWHDLFENPMALERTKHPKCNSGFASICFRNTYFPEDNNTNRTFQGIPKFMHMLRHTFRLSEHSNFNAAIKCFHNTSVAHTIHNHFALTWLRSCSPIVFNERIGQLQHYRNPEKEDTSTFQNTESPKEFQKILQDANILRFKYELMSKSRYVLTELGFLRRKAA